MTIESVQTLLMWFMATGGLVAGIGNSVRMVTPNGDGKMPGTAERFLLFVIAMASFSVAIRAINSVLTGFPFL